jgi:hypothetical protein
VSDWAREAQIRGDLNAVRRAHGWPAAPGPALPPGPLAVHLAQRVARKKAAATMDCPNPIDVTRMGWPEPEYVCGCGACPPPPAIPAPCVCGGVGTHRSEPGVGCTTPGCLCLEPGEHQ